MEEKEQEQKLLCAICKHPIGEHVFWNVGEEVCEECWWMANQDAYYPPED